MTEESIPVHRRRRNARKVVLTIGLLGVAGGIIANGVFATFTNTQTAGPQTISTGKVVLAVGPTNDGATGAANIAAGDTVGREIDLNSTGATIADSTITLQMSAAPSSLLDTDGTNGLQVSIKSCTVAWTRTTPGTPPVAYTCSGVSSTVLIGGAASASVSALEGAPATLGALNSLATGGQDYLVMTLTLPVGAPGDIGKVAGLCSGVSGGTSSTENLEGCSSRLTYTFQATQRAGSAQ